MPPDTLRAALATLGISGETAARALGVGARRVREWMAGERPVPQEARALLWAMLRDAGLLPALLAEFEPAERAMPEAMDRLLWALARDPGLAHALLTGWRAEDGDATPTMDGLLLAVRDRPERATLLRQVGVPG